MFVTFCIHARWVLPENARSVVLECVVRDHMITYALEAAVIMPDHVHVIFWPLRSSKGGAYSLPQILKRIKSTSAHQLNKLLRRSGPVWQEEFFDHAIRKADSLQQKIDYLLMNPVRKGLCSLTSQYRWTWMASADEGVRATS
jgi:REP element-mobilizing transposase RayT